MVNSINLNSQVRTNLYGVKSAQRNVDSTNGKLSTGSKIGGGMAAHNEDSVTLIHSTEVYDRASTFDKTKEGLTQGIDAVKTMSTGIESAEGMVGMMQAYVSGMQNADSGEDFNALQGALSETASQYDDMVSDAKYNGKSLLDNDQSSSTIQVGPNPDHAIKLQALDVSSNNPNININGAVAQASSGGAGLEGAKSLLDQATATLKASNIEVSAKTSLLDSRKDFNEKYSTFMKDSADSETDVDQLKNATELTASNVQNKLAQSTLALSAKQGAFVLDLVTSTGNGNNAN